MKSETSSPEKWQDPVISRKEAFQKAGKYAAYTAATMMLLMSPAHSAVASDSPRPSAPHSPKRH